MCEALGEEWRFFYLLTHFEMNSCKAVKIARSIHNKTNVMTDISIHGADAAFKYKSIGARKMIVSISLWQLILMENSFREMHCENNAPCFSLPGFA